MKEFKVIIAGSRDFKDYRFLKEKVDSLLVNKKHTHRIIIVSGGARGADKLGELYASYNNYPIKLFKADWSKGKSAGMIRNIQMAEYADAAIIFIKNNSRGSIHMLETAQKYDLKVVGYSIQ